LADVEAQLAATVEDYTSLLGSHGAEMSEIRQLLFERDSHALMQAEQIRLEIDRCAKLEGELKTTRLILSSQDGDIATLKEKIGQVRFGANEKMFEARAEIDGLKKELEAKEIEVDEVVEELRDLREDQEKSDREKGEVCPMISTMTTTNVQLLHIVHRLRNDEEKTGLQDRVHDLETQLSTVNYRVRALEDEAEDRVRLLDSRSLLSTSQGGEIAHLRGQLATAEEALYEAQLNLKRQGKSLAKMTEQLETQTTQSQESDLRDAYENAILQMEIEKTRAEDAKSRLAAFTAEMDRVALSETRLKEEIANLRQLSSSDEMTRVELERQVQRLKDDKELLNVALESKQTELALVLSHKGNVRQPSTPGTASSRTLYSSTSRQSVDITPRPLASSTTALAKSSRRESSIVAPSPSKLRAPLGTSTKHNRTPEKQKASSMSTKIVISTSKPKPRTSVDPGAGQISSTQPVISRRSSLPVLRRPASVIEKKRVADLKEEDEDLFA
jgi:chromosome segregation ATPase